MAKYKKSRLNFIRRRKKIIVLALVAILVILLALELSNTTHLFHNSKNTQPGSTSTIDTKDGAISPNSTPGPDKNQNAQSGGSQPSTGSSTNSSSVPLKAPSGTFVSNHHPNLSGSPAPNQMQSTCNTTPGAKCQINFTNGSITKSLPAQTADKEGAVYWSWKLQDIGLTAGTWHIQAVASLDGQTQTVNDALNLGVAP